MADKMRGIHIAIDKTKMRKALLRRQLTMQRLLQTTLRLLPLRQRQTLSLTLRSSFRLFRLYSRLR